MLPFIGLKSAITSKRYLNVNKLTLY